MHVRRHFPKQTPTLLNVLTDFGTQPFSHLSCLQLPGFSAVQRQKCGIAALLVLGMVVASGFPSVPLITAALFTTAGLLLTGSMTARNALVSSRLKD